jgi:hypothetical protein
VIIAWEDQAVISTHVGSVRCEHDELHIGCKLIQAYMLLTVGVLPYADQVTAVKWQYHLMLNWYALIDCRVYVVKTTLSVDNLPEDVLQSPVPHCGQVPITEQKTASNIKVSYFRDL